MNEKQHLVVPGLYSTWLSLLLLEKLHHQFKNKQKLGNITLEYSQLAAGWFSREMETLI